MASSVRAAASIDSGGGDGGGKEPDPKRRRRLDAGGPIEDDETARQKMRDAKVYERGVGGTYGEYAGFDPDNVGDVKSDVCRDDTFTALALLREDAIKPMGYFARIGDLSMMRWLYVHGADTRDVDVATHFPMYVAVQGGRLDACKWLFAHGAAEDIKRRANAGKGPRPLAVAGSWRRSSWLIMNGALCKDDDSGDLDVEIMKEDLGGPGLSLWRTGKSWLAPVAHRKNLLDWANDLNRARKTFLLFLSGTLSTPRNVSPLQVLGGKPGIMKLIGDCVGGIVRGREALIIRRLTELLPELIRTEDEKAGYRGRARLNRDDALLMERMERSNQLERMAETLDLRSLEARFHAEMQAE